MNLNVCAPYKLEKANPTDVGYDLRYAGEEDLVFTKFGERKMVNTGCCIQVGPYRPRYVYDAPVTNTYIHPVQVQFGMDIQVRGRSSLGKAGFLYHLGTVDETYHSGIKVIMFWFGEGPYVIKPGDKIAQLVMGTFIPCEIEEVDFIEEKRGGFGSSGKR